MNTSNQNQNGNNQQGTRPVQQVTRADNSSGTKPAGNTGATTAETDDNEISFEDGSDSAQSETEAKPAQPATKPATQPQTNTETKPAQQPVTQPETKPAQQPETHQSSTVEVDEDGWTTIIVKP